jgi:NAD(P)H-quinone oxidoreductase subunit 5
VFRLVFLGDIQPKTRRTPEVAWPMAVPMVALMVITLLTPVLLWEPLLVGGYWPGREVLGMITSSGLGCGLGATLALQRRGLRSVQPLWRFGQDVLAYDFYMDRVYQATVVQWVRYLSRLTTWLDRYVVDGLVNLVGVSTLLSGQLLKYSASGKSQMYVLTVVIGVLVVGCVFLNSWKWE